MYMKKNLLLIILISNAIFSQTTTFTISGRVEGIQDSTKLFLRDNKAEKAIAYGYVMNERFQIKGTYPTKDSFLYVMLHNKDFSKIKNFWIENEKITFYAPKGNFSDASIKGSSLQLLADQLQNEINPSYDSIRKLKRNLTNKSGPDSTTVQNAISHIETKIDQIQVEFIRKHPNSIFSANLLSVISKKIPVTKTKELYGLIPTYLQNSNYGQLIKKIIDLKKEIKVGETFIDFEQRGTDGKK